MVFSTNQVRHLYVANELKEGSAHVLENDGAGAISVKADADKSHLYFEYKSTDNLVRSDLVKVENILSVKASDASSMERKLKAVTVKLDENLNAGMPIACQDYILRIAFRQFNSIGDDDMYFKHGMVHAYAGMTDSDFYKNLAISLAKNFSREPEKMLEFYIGDMEITYLTKLDDIKDEAESIIIKEVKQPWILGTRESRPVYFDVIPTSVIYQGDERTWGIVEEVEDKDLVVVKNGEKIADLEYFCMGERGDIYRTVGFPDYVRTEYLVDPKKTYHCLDIHYCYIGSNESVQKSEKTITIVSTEKSIINGIVSQMNALSGKDFKGLIIPDDSPALGDDEKEEGEGENEGEDENND